MITNVLSIPPHPLATSAATFICIILTITYFWYIRKFEPNTTFGRSRIEGLPMEILNDILTRLECQDILRVRQVSQRLGCATRMRSIWIALVKTSGVRFMVTKRFELYTAQELESLVCRKARRDAHWACNDGSITPHRLPVKHWIGSDYIFPGGRWLVSDTVSGSIIYLDLDSESFEWRTLVAGGPPDSARYGDHSMCLDFSQTAYSDYPSANLLSFLRRKRTKDELSTFPPGSDHTNHIQVFRIRVEFSDLGFISGLKADLLSSFHESSAIGDFYSLVLRGRTLAYHPVPTNCCVIVDWEQANGKILNFPRTIIDLDTTHSDLLSETVMFTWTRDELYVYDLSSLGLPISMKPATLYHSPAIKVDREKIWSLQCPTISRLGDQSPPISNDTSVSVLFADEGIVKLTVPKSEEPPSLTMLGTEATLRCILEPEQGAEFRDGSMITYRYRKALDGSIISIDSFARNMSGLDTQDGQLFLDTYSSRICMKTTHSLYVVDLE